MLQRPVHPRPDRVTAAPQDLVADRQLDIPCGQECATLVLVTDQQERDRREIAVPVTGIAHEITHGDGVAIRFKPFVDSACLVPVYRQLPDIGNLLARDRDDTADKLAGPVIPLALRKIDEVRQHRRCQQDTDAACDNLVWLHDHVGMHSIDDRLVTALVLAQDHEQVGIDLLGRHDDGEVVDIEIRAGNDSDSFVDTGLHERFGLCSLAHDAAGLWCTGHVRRRLDDDDIKPFLRELFVDGLAEPAIATEDPLAVLRGIDRLGQGAMGDTTEPFTQQVESGGLQRN